MIQSKTSRIGRVFQLLLLLALCAISLFPFLVMLGTSFKEMAEIRSASMTLWPQKWTLENYVNIFTKGNWGQYFFNSFYVTTVSVIGALAFNSMAGYAFARLHFKGSKLLFMLALLGMMVPAQVTMLPAYVLMRYVPFAGGNNWLGQGGSGLLDSYAGLFVANLCGSYGVFLFRQFLMGFPGSLDDAARVDGLSRFGTYLRIYMPLSGPVIATMVVIRATSTWNDYVWPLLITQKEKMYTVQLALSQYRSDTGDIWNMIMAATTLIVLPVTVLFLILQKYFVEGIVTTGIKG